ncbi:nuclear transport factor 2 family protein [Streptomyces zhihengii]|uniref:Nuclear transport factor 2 family protein n=1 Tax=Streptomyces zhihengii TaxID=1818004 RepID=A0ABS2UKR0_9ACTN|nr:nuclear transport factor 2 family protein [Streptomyces zhihengii]MBM9618129.1 nuclear transport factor 2 family protein [Streptomyces zhihengii]
MSTTRHLVNRRRRLATTAARTATAPAGEPTAERPGTDRPGHEAELPPPGTEPGDGPEPDGTAPAAAEDTGTGERTADATDTTDATDTADATDTPSGKGSPSARTRRLPVILCLLTVLLGGFAAYAATQASSLRDDPATRNTALTDIARTSEVKGAATQAVEAVFSYDFADPEALDRAVRTHLTGEAVRQHTTMLAAVRDQGPKQKLLLTTTVTESGVERIDGDRARVLVYADQSNTRTAPAKSGDKAAEDERTYAAAMLAVDLVRTDGTWRIANLDTLGAGS